MSSLVMNTVAPVYQSETRGLSVPLTSLFWWEHFGYGHSSSHLHWVNQCTHRSLLEVAYLRIYKVTVLSWLDFMDSLNITEEQILAAVLLAVQWLLLMFLQGGQDFSLPWLVQVGILQAVPVKCIIYGLSEDILFKQVCTDVSSIKISDFTSWPYLL